MYIVGDFIPQSIFLEVKPWSQHNLKDPQGLRLLPSFRWLSWHWTLRPSWHRPQAVPAAPAQPVLNPPALRDPCFREPLLQSLFRQSPGHWNVSAFTCAETEGSSLCWKNLPVWGLWGGFCFETTCQAQMPWNHDIDLEIMRFRK